MLLVFAGQGYVTIFMNPTGSTTFGQGIYPVPSTSNAFSPRHPELTDAIAEDWGGKPFVDMQKGWKYILGEYPEVCSRLIIPNLPSSSMCFLRLTKSERSQQEHPGAVMQSTGMCCLQISRRVSNRLPQDPKQPGIRIQLQSSSLPRWCFRCSLQRLLHRRTLLL